MATQAAVKRASEAPALEHRQGEPAHAGLVVELPTLRHHAALDVTLALLTHEAGVDPWRPGGEGARSRAEGRGYRPRRGGWAARSWSRCVYIAARVTSAEKRTELTRLIPRGGQGGGPALEETRPGRVG